MSAAPTDTPSPDRNSNTRKTIQKEGKKNPTAKVRVWLCPGDGKVWPIKVSSGPGLDSFDTLDRSVLERVNPSGDGGVEYPEVGFDKDGSPISAVCHALGYFIGLPLNKTVPFCHGPVVLYRTMSRADKVLDLELESAIEAVSKLAVRGVSIRLPAANGPFKANSA